MVHVAMAQQNAKHYYRRGDVYWYRRRTPLDVRDVEPREVVHFSLHTDSEGTARSKAEEITRASDEAWELLRADQAEAARDRLERIKRIARSRGFTWRAVEDVAAADLSELLARIEALEGSHRPEQPPNPDLKAALLGTAQEPDVSLDDARDRYFEVTKDIQRGKTAEQLRVWKGAYLRAWKSFADAVGDRPLGAVTRAELLDWCDTLWERVEAGEISVETANKQISLTSAMCSALEKRDRLAVPNFRDLRFSGADSSRREPFSNAWIQDRLLAPGAFAGLNPEARAIFYAMVETGMGVSEAVNRPPEQIILDAEIPHVRVRPTATRQLKTKVRARDIPLVGVSLMAYQAFPQGFQRYWDRETAASAVILKYMRSNGLRETENSTNYGLRHSFEDRMIEAGADERMRSEMMGHSYKREKYGLGPTLEVKAALLRRMAFTPPPEI